MQLLCQLCVRMRLRLHKETDEIHLVSRFAVAAQRRKMDSGVRKGLASPASRPAGKRRDGGAATRLGEVGSGPQVLPWSDSRNLLFCGFHFGELHPYVGFNF